MSVLPTVAAGLVLAVVLARAAVVDRERALLLWALAAAAYSMRVAVEASAFQPSTFGSAASYSLGVASALLLLAGVLRFTGRVPSSGLFLLAGSLAVAGSVTLRAVGADPALAAAPSFVLQGAARIVAGVVWFRRRRPGPGLLS